MRGRGGTGRVMEGMAEGGGRGKRPEARVFGGGTQADGSLSLSLPHHTLNSSPPPPAALHPVSADARFLSSFLRHPPASDPACSTCFFSFSLAAPPRTPPCPTTSPCTRRMPPTTRVHIPQRPHPAGSAAAEVRPSPPPFHPRPTPPRPVPRLTPASLRSMPQDEEQVREVRG